MAEPTELIPAQNQGLTTAGLVPVGLTPAQYGALAAVPPELEWLANLTKIPKPAAPTKATCASLPPSRGSTDPDN